MEVDLRKHAAIRKQVHAGISALRVQGRQIWGTDKLSLDQIVVRLTVGVGDLARLVRDSSRVGSAATEEYRTELEEAFLLELKKELGNIIFSTIRWVDDLGIDVMECLVLAIQAQEAFAKSGRPR